MATLFVRHDVEDFDRWKSGYDENSAIREKHGVKEAGIYKGTDDPNDVTVYHVFDSADAAKEFASSEELRDAMQDIGVSGQPQIWLTEEVERNT